MFTDTRQSGLCNINPISTQHTSSEQSSTTTGKEGMKGMSTNVQSTWQDEKTSERITETQMESNNGYSIYTAFFQSKNMYWCKICFRFNDFTIHVYLNCKNVFVFLFTTLLLLYMNQKQTF